MNDKYIKITKYNGGVNYTRHMNIKYRLVITRNYIKRYGHINHMHRVNVWKSLHWRA